MFTGNGDPTFTPRDRSLSNDSDVGAIQAVPDDDEVPLHVRRDGGIGPEIRDLELISQLLTEAVETLADDAVHLDPPFVSCHTTTNAPPGIAATLGRPGSRSCTC